MIRQKRPVLLLIDIQQGFSDEAYWGGNRNNPDAEKVAGRLLERWRAFDLPRIHVRHSSTNTDSRLHESHSGFAFHTGVLPQPDELVITKQVNSAFIDTDLHERLQKMAASCIVIAGLTTDHCVSTTARMSGNLGYETYVISDAVATFDKVDFEGNRWPSETVHAVSLASLEGEFAKIIDAQTLIESL